MTDLLRVEDLAVSFNVEGGQIDAVRGVSFRVPQGGTVALVGESGSGKSVISQTIMGILPRAARIVGGKILFADPLRPGTVTDIAALSTDGPEMRAIRGGRISIIFQEPMTSLSPIHTIGDQICEALHLHRKAGAPEGRELVTDMLRLVGFPDPAKALTTYPFELSGGLRQRAMIAMALDLPAGAPDRRRTDHGARRDDPGADPEADAGPAGRARHGRPRHHPRPRRGRQHGGRDRRSLSRQGHGERHAQRHLQPAGPSLSARAAPCRAAFSHGAGRAAGADPRNRVGERPPAGRQGAVAGGCRRGRSAAVGTQRQPAFSAAQERLLRGRANGAVIAVDDVSFEIRRGECLGLVGESGCGKTTLSKIIMRALKPDSGSIQFNDRGKIVDVLALEKKALIDFRRRIQFIFQDPFGSLNPRMTVYDILSEPLVIHGVRDAAWRDEMVKELMHVVGLGKRHLQRYPHSFSGGQRQRIGIARALALKPDLLICDEPVSALDVSIQAQILNLLKDSAGPARPHLSLHFAQPGRRGLHRRSHRGDVRRPPRRAGAEGTTLPAARSSLYARPAGRSAATGPEVPARFHAADGRQGLDLLRWPAPFTIDEAHRPSPVAIGDGHYVQAENGAAIPEHAS